MRHRNLSVCLLPAPCLSDEAGESPLEAAECPSSVSLQPPPLHLQSIFPGHLAGAGHLPPACWRTGKPLSPAWACGAETPASSSRLPGSGPALHTCPHRCSRGRALLQPSGGTGGAPTLSGPPSLHQQDEGVPSVVGWGGGAAGGGNLTLAESSMSHVFLHIIHKGMFILLTKKQALSFFSSWRGGPLGLFFPTFHQKRGQRRPTHFPLRSRK